MKKGEFPPTRRRPSELLTCSGPKSEVLAPAGRGALGAVGRRSAGHPSGAAMTNGLGRGGNGNQTLRITSQIT